MQRNNNIARIIAIRDNLMPDKAQKSRDKSRARRMGAICRKERGFDNFFKFVNYFPKIYAANFSP